MSLFAYFSITRLLKKTLGARRRRSKLDNFGAFRVVSPEIKDQETSPIIFDASDLVEEDTAPPERVQDIAVKPEEVWVCRCMSV